MNNYIKQALEELKALRVGAQNYTDPATGELSLEAALGYYRTTNREIRDYAGSLRWGYSLYLEDMKTEQYTLEDLIDAARCSLAALRLCMELKKEQKERTKQGGQ